MAYCSTCRKETELFTAEVPLPTQEHPHRILKEAFCEICHQTLYALEIEEPEPSLELENTA